MTAWERFNEVWDASGSHGARKWAEKWVPVAAETMIDRRRQMEKDYLKEMMQNG